MHGAGAEKVRSRSRRLLLPLLLALASIFFVGSIVAYASYRAEQSQQKAEAAAKKRSKVVRNAFRVKAEIRDPRSNVLSIGEKKRVKLKFFNRQKFPLWVYDLRISGSVDKAHAAAGCSIKRDFQFYQLKRRSYPFKVNKGRMKVIKKRIKGKVRRSKRMVWWHMPVKITTRTNPAMRLHDLPGVNQDACKGATVIFKITARAERTKQAARKQLKKTKKKAKKSAAEPLTTTFEGGS